MIAVDTNILVYAHRDDSEWHAAAHRCVEGLYQGNRPWCIPWTCVHEFLAVVTHPRVYKPPTPMNKALGQLSVLADSPRLRFIGETMSHTDTLGGLLEEGQIRGPKVYDARIASVCLEHGVEELWSADRDFGRFPLTVVNPLIPER